MTRSTFDTKIALSLLDSKQEFPVDFNRAWRWLGFTTKQNAKYSLLNSGFVEGIDFMITQQLGTLALPRPKEEIYITVDCFKTWGMMANTEQGKEVRRYFLECEKTAKTQAAQSAIPEASPVLALPPVLPEISKRNLVRKLVDERSAATNIRHDYLWRQAYSELDYLFGYNIGNKKCKGSKIERIEADGQLDNLIAIMQKLWTPNLQIPEPKLPTIRI
jgi:phage anti-repressor protein